MNLGEILIGNNMADHPNCLGVYIGVDELYVAQSVKSEGGVVLESLIRVPTNLLDKNKLKALDLNEAFFQMDYWLDALGKVTSKKTWNTNKVVVSLSPDFCLLRHFVISIPMKRQEWAEGVPNEARKYIHFPFDKAVYSYHVYEFETAATKQKRLGVVFAMTSKTIISRLEKGLKSVGLELVSVEPSCLSLARAFCDNDKEAVGKGGRIYSFFGKDMASFIFLNGVVPLLERDVDISGSAPAERRRFGLTNSAEFIAKQLERDPFEEAVIAGYKMDQWVPALEADSHKPVRQWNLKEVFGIETKSAGEVASIGASGKFFDQKIPDIDFTKGKRLSAYEFNASWMLWKIVFVLIGLLGLFLAGTYAQLLYANYQLKKKSSSYSQPLEDLQGLTAKQVKTNLDNIRKQNEVLSQVYANSPLVTPILSGIAQAMQDNMWLTRVSYQADFAGRSAASLILEGAINSGGNGENDLEIGRRFGDALKNQPSLRRFCSDAAISYKNLAGAGSGVRSRKKEVNRDTLFVLTCNQEPVGRRRATYGD